jgi:ATP-binding cassette, subfamily B, bacterial
MSVAADIVSKLRGLRFLELVAHFSGELRPERARMVVAAVAGVGLAIVTLAQPWPLQIVFDAVLLGQPVDLFGYRLGNDARWLLPAAVASIVLLEGLRGILYYTQSVESATAGQNIVRRVRQRLFVHLLRLPLGYHRRAKIGDTMMRLTGDILMLREMVTAGLVMLLSQSLVVVGILIVMFVLSPRLTLVALGVVPALYLIVSRTRARLVDVTRKQRKHEGALSAVAHEAIGGIAEVKALGAETFERQRFGQLDGRSLKAGVKTARHEARMNLAVGLAISVGVSLLLWFGVADVQSGRLSAGELLVVLAYVGALYKPLRQLSKLTQRMAKTTACGERVLEVFRQEPEALLDDGPALHDVRGKIVFRDVHFTYDHGNAASNSPPSLAGIDLTVQPGEVVAIVGPTGSGKSTLLSLLLRFYSPQRGVIEIDDTPIDRVCLRSLRQQLAYVQQDSVIRGATIAENILYGISGLYESDDPTPDMAEVTRVARAANAHEFIIRLPGGYDTLVGERGSTLSGGQRQRLALARAHLRRSPIVLLDEATQGLDAESEQLVLEGLGALLQGRTALLIAHRLNTVRLAHRVIFLERGRIVESGSHDELVMRGGRYASFCAIQGGRVPVSAL